MEGAAAASTVGAVAVFRAAVFVGAAASEEAGLEAVAVLAAPIAAQPHRRAPVPMPVRRPVRMEDRAGMALPTVVPYTEARVRMAPLVAAAPPTT